MCGICVVLCNYCMHGGRLCILSIASVKLCASGDLLFSINMCAIEMCVDECVSWNNQREDILCEGRCV